MELSDIIRSFLMIGLVGITSIQVNAKRMDPIAECPKIFYMSWPLFSCRDKSKQCDVLPKYGRPYTQVHNGYAKLKEECKKDASKRMIAEDCPRTCECCQPWDRDSGWILGDNGETCNSICGKLGRSCDSAKIRSIINAEDLKSAMSKAGRTCLRTFYPGEKAFGGLTNPWPYKWTYRGTPGTDGNGNCVYLLFDYDNNNDACERNDDKSRLRGHYPLCYCSSKGKDGSALRLYRFKKIERKACGKKLSYSSIYNIEDAEESCLRETNCKGVSWDWVGEEFHLCQVGYDYIDGVDYVHDKFRECKVNGKVGDGTTRGSCQNGHTCHADGTCILRVDGQWSEWSSWLPCTKSCRGGRAARRRKCNSPAPFNGGSDCWGKSEELRDCNAHIACPVDGQWGEWEPWSACNKSCGDGQAERTRQCNNPAPSNGGSACGDEAKEIQDCNVKSCPPVDGQWGEWEGMCLKTCGGGQVLRTRECNNPPASDGGSECVGIFEKMEDCNPEPCPPVDGQWGEWESWSDCSKTCGGGQQERSRECNNPPASDGGSECVGESTDIHVCNFESCPIDGQWGDWESWSACTKICDESSCSCKATRRRDCDDPTPSNGGVLCNGYEFLNFSKQTQECSIESCPDVCEDNPPWYDLRKCYEVASTWDSYGQHGQQLCTLDDYKMHCRLTCRLCEKVTPCDEGEYCKNGGACRHYHDTLNPEKSRTYCDCTDTGYEGERCDEKLPEKECTTTEDCVSMACNTDTGKCEPCISTDPRVIGDFRWTRGSTSDVCAVAQGNNCILSLEEMGFGSDMKHLSGFDPNLHCCFCQKLVNDCIDDADCASFQTCREQFVAWVGGDKGEVFGPSFCDPVIEHGRNLNKECSSHCNNNIGYCEWCDEGIDKHQAERRGVVRKGVCCMKGLAEAECDGTIGGHENSRCVAIDTELHMTTTTSTTTIAATNTKPFVRDPQNDNKKCSIPGSANRLFKLSGPDATETNCQYECEKIQNCVAFSGIWRSWCIGCKIPLSTYHDGAIAFRKVSSKCNSNFVDSGGDNCQVYFESNYCTSSGGYGQTWNYGWGIFEDYSTNGETAFVCPQCGCSEAITTTTQSTTPEQTTMPSTTTVEECVDLDDGALDSWGDSCQSYSNTPEWCGSYYDDDDFSAMSMCCACMNLQLTTVQPTTVQPTTVPSTTAVTTNVNTAVTTTTKQPMPKPKPKPSTPKPTISTTETSKPEPTTSTPEPSKPEPTKFIPKLSTSEPTTSIPETSTPKTTTYTPKPSTPEQTTSTTELSTPEPTVYTPKPSTPEPTISSTESSSPEPTTTSAPEPSKPDSTTFTPDLSTLGSTTSILEPSTPKPTTSTPMPSTPEPTTSTTKPTTLEPTTHRKPTSMNPNPTTTHHDGSSRYPKRALGMYILLADNTEEGFGDDAEWEPKLFEYQQTGANVLYFTFIDPKTMNIPKAFEKLSATRGSLEPGAVPKDTKIIYAIGGYEYSLHPNPWDWLTSKDKAEEMAEVVATWPDLYNCDGIDLDIESGAGDHKEAGPNMIHFLKKLRQLQPNMIISQPTYGYPQVNAEDDVINESCSDKSKPSNWLLDSVGLMVYEGTQALQYVKNYAEAESQWEGFPITCNTPYHQILLGCKGSSDPSSIDTLASETLRQDLLGIMVWYASVQNGFQYEESWDASTNEKSQQAYIDAMKKLNA